MQIAELWLLLHVAKSSHQLIGCRDTLSPAAAVTTRGEGLFANTIDVQRLIDTANCTGGQKAAGQEVGILTVTFAGETQMVLVQKLATEEEAHREGNEMQEKKAFLTGREVTSLEHGIAMHLTVTLAATILKLAVRQVVGGGVKM